MRILHDVANKDSEDVLCLVKRYASDLKVSQVLVVMPKVRDVMLPGPVPTVRLERRLKKNAKREQWGKLAEKHPKHCVLCDNVASGGDSAEGGIAGCDPMPDNGGMNTKYIYIYMCIYVYMFLYICRTVYVSGHGPESFDQWASLVVSTIVSSMDQTQQLTRCPS
jgi:hypothetical protein